MLGAVNGFGLVGKVKLVAAAPTPPLNSSVGGRFTSVRLVRRCMQETRVSLEARQSTGILGQVLTYRTGNFGTIPEVSSLLARAALSSASMILLPKSLKRLRTNVT